MMVTLLSALYYALVFFPAISYVLGPEGQDGNITERIATPLKHYCRRRDEKLVASANERLQRQLYSHQLDSEAEVEPVRTLGRRVRETGRVVYSDLWKARRHLSARMPWLRSPADEAQTMVETLCQMSDETQARLFEHNIVVTSIERAYDAGTGVLQHAQQPVMPIQDSQEPADND